MVVQLMEGGGVSREERHVGELYHKLFYLQSNSSVALQICSSRIAAILPERCGLAGLSYRWDREGIRNVALQSYEMPQEGAIRVPASTRLF